MEPEISRALRHAVAAEQIQDSGGRIHHADMGRSALRPYNDSVPTTSYLLVSISANACGCSASDSEPLVNAMVFVAGSAAAFRSSAI